MSLWHRYKALPTCFPLYIEEIPANLWLNLSFFQLLKYTRTTGTAFGSAAHDKRGPFILHKYLHKLVKMLKIKCLPEKEAWPLSTFTEDAKGSLQRKPLREGDSFRDSHPLHH